ncbi:spore maturation protein [Clostridium formicaceticum]|uniref:Spore maturation protein n=1 Tax=Clostridium formicaceticum TaxID=1497 RepID=A0AAC9RLL6_9CLOT|nr:spore maturation protein [Clostridium formicaceticum]AOY75046.1 spore maturation protein [Clostridium formicaceticum]ARE89466.1 Spore maturation protein B [Clostridium formicaceticum]
MFITIIDSISKFAIPFILLTIPAYGFFKKVKVYEAFTDGAKEGFYTAVRIIPYLVAMLVAIGIFRASGAMDLLVNTVSPITSLIGMPGEVLTMAIMRPLSGGGAQGIMSELITTHGADSLIGRMVSVIHGSTETTFYVLAVYFGAVAIKKTRHALPAGLIADVVGIIAAVIVVRIMFP